tara:strand:+ start:445 stop:720 length:276 start_codon:yes stop_codon:yes gene_type:complete
MVTQAERLTRIEEKIDKLSEVIVSIARAEEKIYGLQDDHDKMFDRVNKIQERVDSIEIKVEENSRTTKLINKLIWVVLVALAGAMTQQLWM